MTHTEQVLWKLRTQLEVRPNPTPVFDLRIGFAREYDQLFSSEFSETQPASAILDRALDDGRLLLTGRGGGAKTVILTRIAKTAAERGVATVLLSLKEWTAADNVGWRTLASSRERVSYLFQRFSGLDLQPRQLDLLDFSLPRLMILDGLNEVTSRTGQEIIDAFDEYARFALNTCTIVSDRLVRRDFIRPDRWTLCIVLPLSPEQIADAVKAVPSAALEYSNSTGEQRELLSTPYFLSEFLRGERLAVTRASQMRDYFARHALDDLAMDQTAEAAFAVYADETRTFSFEKFRGHAGEVITNRLLATGALVRDGDLAFFDHHLKHDYLASRYLVSDRKHWTSSAFNTVTFHGSSFETVVMAMEQMRDSVAADELLRRLYDWNIYGAGYSIAEGRASRVSVDMQVVILAMFAERRWDLVKATAQRASDTLRLIDNARALVFLNAQSLSEVFATLQAVQPRNEWFDNWRRLFTRQVASPAEDKDIRALSETDSVMGWTTANVLRRLTCSASQEALVRGLLADQDATVQWRAVHVLGGFTSRKNAEVLVDALYNAPAVEVRFGAIRSLIEMAGRDGGELARWIFERIASHVSNVREHGSVLGEFERAIFIDESRAPNNWTSLVAVVISALQSVAPNAEDRDRWDRLLTKLVTTYGL